MENKKFTYITAFSGCGGSALGLQQAGGEGLMAIEWDPYDKSQNAYQHLVKNFPEMHEQGRILNEDICTISGERILKVTGLKKFELSLYQSSAPCQGFSASNTKRDANDLRNDLFFESIKHVDVLRPSVAVFENVAGMTRGKMRGKFHQIVKALENLGYKVGTWVLNASDYGAPQTRPRTWIIAVREGLGLPSVPEFRKGVVSLTDVLPYLDGHMQGQFSKSWIPGATKPISTITKSAGIKVIQNGIPRNPKIEELRILCTFPDDYQFVGPKSKIHQKLGNSVLPLQMRVIAEHLYETILMPNEPLLQKAEEAVNHEILPNSVLDDFSQQLLAEVA